jgi:multidrug efflux system membrane fusion protein
MKRILIALLTTLAMAGCHSSKKMEQAPQAVEVRRMESQAGTAAGGLRFSAVVSADAEAPLSFRIPGYIVSLKQVRGQGGRMRDIAEGDRITRGTILARIRSSEYQDKVRQASSQAAAAEAVAFKAKLDFDRASRLYGDQSLTKPEFEAAKAQYDSSQGQLRAAEASTSEAQVSLNDTAIVAPFDGEVVKKAVELGSYASPSSSVFTIAKTDVVKIVIGVPDTAVQSIKLGQPVDVAVDAFSNRTFQARISRIASAADPKTRNFEVEVAIPNRDHQLKVGMIGSLQLTAPEEPNQQVSFQVPLSSVVQSPDGKYGVFVLMSSPNAGSIARLRTVELGTVSGSEINVASGLAAGEEVVTTGANLLKDGQRVEVVR